MTMRTMFTALFHFLTKTTVIRRNALTSNREKMLSSEELFFTIYWCFTKCLIGITTLQQKEKKTLSIPRNLLRGERVETCGMKFVPKVIMDWWPSCFSLFKKKTFWVAFPPRKFLTCFGEISWMKKKTKTKKATTW